MPTAQLIRKAAGVEKGSGVPNRNKVGKITKAQVKEIAEMKQKDLNAIDLEGATVKVMGTARSMGVDIANNSEFGIENSELAWESSRSLAPQGESNGKGRQEVQGAAAKVDREKLYSTAEAVQLVKEKPASPSSMEPLSATSGSGVHCTPMSRCGARMPAVPVRILVFAQGVAREAGADIVADTDEWIKKIQDGFTEFDAVAIATPDMMGKVGRLARGASARAV